MYKINLAGDSPVPAVFPGNACGVQKGNCIFAKRRKNMDFNKTIATNFSQVVDDIKRIIDTGRNAAYAAVDATMIAGASWKKSNTGRSVPNTARN